MIEWSDRVLASEVAIDVAIFFVVMPAIMLTVWGLTMIVFAYSEINVRSDYARWHWRRYWCSGFDCSLGRWKVVSSGVYWLATYKLAIYRQPLSIGEFVFILVLFLTCWDVFRWWAKERGIGRVAG